MCSDFCFIFVTTKIEMADKCLFAVDARYFNFSSAGHVT